MAGGYRSLESSLAQLAGLTRPISAEASAAQLLAQMRAFLDSGVHATGVGPREATKIVAASNALQTSKDGADYVCDGVADDVQIQAALDALPQTVSNDGGSGGGVQLSEGIFHLADTVLLPSQAWLRGNGFSTVLRLASGGGRDLINLKSTATFWPSVSDMVLEGRRANQTPATAAINMVGGLGGGAGDLSLTVDTVVGTFPPRRFIIKIENEILFVSAGFGTLTWTVERGQMGTARVAHADDIVITQLGPNGIVLDNSNGGSGSDAPYGQGTAYQTLWNLFILNCKGFGVIATGKVSPNQDFRASRLRIQACDGGGLHVDTPDSLMEHITVHSCGDALVGNGFQIQGGGQFVALKAALCEGQGFRVGPASGVSSGGTFTICSGEDCKGDGWYFDRATGVLLSACKGNGNGLSAGTRQKGFHVSALASYISFDNCRAESAGSEVGTDRKQAYGLYIEAGAKDIHWKGGMLLNNYGSDGDSYDGAVFDAGTRTVIKDPIVTEVNNAETKQYKSSLLALAAAYTIKASDNGLTFLVSAADLTITLPATAPGLTYTFMLAAGGLSAGTGLSISPAAADSINGAGLTSVDDKDLILSGASDREGDMVTVVGDGVDGWYITSIVGTWAKE